MKRLFIENKILHIRIGIESAFLEITFEYGPGPHYFGRFGFWLN